MLFLVSTLIITIKTSDKIYNQCHPGFKYESIDTSFMKIDSVV